MILIIIYNNAVLRKASTNISIIIKAVPLAFAVMLANSVYIFAICRVDVF